MSSEIKTVEIGADYASLPDTGKLLATQLALSAFPLPEEFGGKNGAAVAMGDWLGKLRPSDPIEEMLIAQMIAIHNAGMLCLARSNLDRQDPEHLLVEINLSTKCLRTFAALVEALNRHRGKGQQKVTVEHVHVYKGGQAIVGSVDNPGGRGRGKRKKGGQPHEDTMRRQESAGKAMPALSSSERQVPVSRGALDGSAEGQPEFFEARILHEEGG